MAEFDKNAFENKKRSMTTCTILIALIGIASIVLSLFVGNGWGLAKFFEPSIDEDQQYQDFLDEITPDEDDDFGTDPQNYYGTYYATKDYLINKFEITSAGIKVTLSDLYEEQSKTYSYRYASAEYAKKTFNTECPVIIMYDDNMSEQHGLYWISSSDGKTTLTNDEDLVYTTDAIDFLSLMNDPGDYLGTYFGESDYVIDKIEITSDKINATTSSVIAPAKKAEYKYTFLCAEYAYVKYGRECDVIVAYEKDISGEVRLFWIHEDSGKYTFEGNNGVTYREGEITFKDLVNDPENYYGKYKFDNNNALILEEDGSALFTLNGESTVYSYLYADNGWLSKYYGKDYASAIVLHNGNENEVHIFAFCEDGSLLYGDTYTSVKE